MVHDGPRPTIAASTGRSTYRRPRLLRACRRPPGRWSAQGLEPGHDLVRMAVAGIVVEHGMDLRHRLIPPAVLAEEDGEGEPGGARLQAIEGRALVGVDRRVIVAIVLGEAAGPQVGRAIALTLSDERGELATGIR